MAFHVIRDDITRVKADAIVNTANPEPIFSNGVDCAIYHAAGKEKLLDARKEIGLIRRGDAAATPAFDLDAKYIIHTVGPIWNGGTSGETSILKSCYKKSMVLALELGCKSIAFPLIAAGTYGFPKDQALKIALSAIENFTMEQEMDVTLVVFSTEVLELTGKVFEKIDTYVDNHYVEEAKVREYFDQKYENRREAELIKTRCFDSVEPDRICPNMNSYIDLNAPDFYIEKTFQEKLFEIIDEKGLTGPQVYKNYISKQVYSKIQSDKYYHPNKYTAIALCLSLRLNYKDTLDLIGRAGWTLSPSIMQDVVVKACIINKMYNVAKIDIILLEHGCQSLQYIK